MNDLHAGARTIGALVLSRWRAIALALVLTAGAAVLLHAFGQHRPVSEWVAWRYASYWLLCAVVAASWFSAGHLLVGRMLRWPVPIAERCVLSMAVGLLAFVLLVFVFGLVGFHGLWTFVAAPTLLLAAGGRSVFLSVRRLRRHAGRRPVRFAGASISGTVLAVLGVLSLALSYLPIIVPENLAYDSRWYHMAIAEHYAAQGSIRRFPEGWFLGAYPQLASYLYTWAFLSPLPTLFDKVELAAHLEFTLFLGTLLGVSVLARRLLFGRRVPWAWVAVFAFPGRFVYDSTLSGAADHIAAFWAAPIFLALLRALPRLEAGRTGLLGLFAAAALLTKYSAVGLVIIPALAIVARGLVLAIPRCRGLAEKRAWWLGPMTFGVVLGIATAPHWLKNLIWYSDPVYPLGRGLFPSRPWTVDTPDRMGHFTPKEWMAERSWKGVGDTLDALYQFSFVPHDWPMFHGTLPLFGSLFTLSVPCLFLLRRASRLWLLYGATHIAVAAWFWMFHQDRYLQACVPWMAAGVAAVAARVWAMGWIARPPLIALAGVQLAWGANAPFIPSHAMLAASPLKAGFDFLATGYAAGPSRLERLGTWETVGQMLKGKARLLLHEEHLHLGVGVPTVSDWIGWQGGISYGRAPAPSSVYDLMRRLGVTHLLWQNGVSRGYDSIAGDIAFFTLAHLASEPRYVGGHVVARLPPHRPSSAPFTDRALLLGCGQNYASGLFRVSDLTVTVLATPRPPTDYPPPRIPLSHISDLDALVPTVDAIVVEGSCATLPPAATSAGFTISVTRGPATIWLRRRS
jgi:hypothetical protein